jgi:hypothetical protein
MFFLSQDAFRFFAVAADAAPHQEAAGRTHAASGVLPGDALVERAHHSDARMDLHLG